MSYTTTDPAVAVTGTRPVRSEASQGRMTSGVLLPAHPVGSRWLRGTTSNPPLSMPGPTSVRGTHSVAARYWRSST